MGRDALTRDEAEERASRISEVSYRISLDLRAGAPDYRATTEIEFTAGGGDDTFLEFVGGDIESFSVNGADMAPDWDGTRIVIPGRLLGDHNRVRVAYRNDYDHAGEGFHQFFDPEDKAEYLYTQFEPYSAHRLFPCFDQPDIKATYELDVTAPREWTILSAGRIEATEDVGGGRSVRHFEETVPFSTYLVSVIAGDYVGVQREHQGLPMGLYTRRTLLEHLDADELFATTAQGLGFFTELFGRPYPFPKYDQAFVPEFNWGGMENVAAVTYIDRLIFRDPPTRDQLIRRDEILLHELAHQWFGNLVTMKWWNDLWLNETFATFAAYLAVEASGHWDDVWQDFNTRNKVVAYKDDQRPTTHPVATEVKDTDEVFLNFDQVTYGKGASVMRQLVATIGIEAFASGLKTYFSRYAFGNTTLADFLGALEQGSGRDLAGWAAKWLTTSNVNTLEAEVEEHEGRIAALRIHQRASADHPHLRPHRIHVALVDPVEDAVTTEVFPVDIDGARALVPGAAGRKRPALVFPNFEDLTYAKVALDARSLDFVKQSLPVVDDPLLRHNLWQSLWEMVRDRLISSTEYLGLVRRHLPVERSELIVNFVVATAAGTLARYVPEDRKLGAIADHVETARAAVAAVPPGDLRVIWARSLLRAVTSPEHLALAGRLVDGDEAFDGLHIDQDMRWEVAVRWMAHGVAGAEERLAAELERDPSDRGRRGALRAEVARPEAEVKAAAWDKIHAGGYPSLYYAQSAMSGFGWWTQADLLAPYAAEFFDRVESIVAEWEWEAAKAYYHGLYPSYRVDHEILARSSQLAATADPRLRRLAVESVDDLERALACRALVAAEAVT